MARSFKVIENFGDVASWTVLGNDTDNLADSTVRLWGSNSLKFDKVDGAAGTIHAGAYKTYAGVQPFKDFTPLDRIGATVYTSTVADVAYAWIRMGADASNYVEWRLEDSTLLAGWSAESVKLGDCYLPTSTTGFALFGDTDPVYLAVGVAFDAQDDTLADIKFDSVWVAKNQRTVS